jgi:hypothetical protein
MLLLMRGRVVAMQGDVGSKGCNWHEYNDSLVKRGEMYLTFDFIENWDRDLEALNRGKLGRNNAYVISPCSPLPKAWFDSLRM